MDLNRGYHQLRQLHVGFLGRLFRTHCRIHPKESTEKQPLEMNSQVGNHGNRKLLGISRGVHIGAGVE